MSIHSAASAERSWVSSAILQPRHASNSNASTAAQVFGSRWCRSNVFASSRFAVQEATAVAVAQDSFTNTATNGVPSPPNAWS
ncbi:hypothetical protein ASD30_06410 [Nocardioides sp. Root140]|nr:hypothetical protein ASD30_06410 [Nocardioides sp. Root140]